MSSSWQLDLIVGLSLLAIGIFTRPIAWFFYRLNRSFLENVPIPSAWGIWFVRMVLIGAGVVILASSLLRASGR